MRCILTLGVITASLAFGDIVTNNPAWDGVTTVAAWGGLAGTPTYGETVTVPTDGDRVLSSFTVNIIGGSLSIPFNAYVQAWNGASPVGSPLFTQSGATNTTAGVSSYTFSPDLTLTPGASYLLYLSTLGISQPTSDGLAWGATTDDTYSGGSFEFAAAGQGNPAAGSVSDLTSATFTNGSTCCDVSDLAFDADFTAPSVTSPASEPSTGPFLTVVAVSFAGVLFMRRRTSARGPSRRHQAGWSSREMEQISPITRSNSSSFV